MISVRVLKECASVLRRKAGPDWPEIAAVLSDTQALADAPPPLTVVMHERALVLVGQGGCRSMTR